MRRKSQLSQIILLFIGILLILITYYLYPKLVEQNFSKIDQNIEQREKSFDQKNIDPENNELKNRKVESSEFGDDPEKDEINKFLNVQYEGIYGLDNEFTVISNEAKIFTTDPDVVVMKNMKATIYMKDGRVVIITSDTGTYNKKTYDCFFKKNVKATDGETTLLSDNLDLLATKDFASVYDNVFLTNERGILKADKVDYDFNTDRYLISMFGDGKVDIKLIK